MQGDQAAFLAAVWHRICRWFPIGTTTNNQRVAMVSASCSFPSNAVMMLPALRMGSGLVPQLVQHFCCPLRQERNDLYDLFHINRNAQ